MKWSKLRKLVQGLLADSLQERVKYNLTRYGPGVSGIMVRGWITLDGQEIFNFSTIKLIRKYHDDTGKWWPESPEIFDELHSKSLYTRAEYIDALEEYVSLTIENALSSSNPLVRAFAVFDRRLGKRRLRSMVLKDEDNLIIRNFYSIRCDAEGISPRPPASTDIE